MRIRAITAYTRGFDEPVCRDPREYGGKAAGLAELTAAGLPVAPGFAIGAAAYRAFLDESGMRPVMAAALAAAPDDRYGRDAAAGHITRRLAAAPVPGPVATAIRSRYQRLCEEAATWGSPLTRRGSPLTRRGSAGVPVAVRSSATAEDSAAASFAGEFDTWVDIAGAEDVIAHVRRCWASVFADRAISYARACGTDPTGVEMAVVVQRMVSARAAGVMFTINPVTGDRSRIVIEASWGLGLAVVGGEVTPDRWVVDKAGLTVVERTPGDKRIEYRCGEGAVDVDPALWGRPCLTDEQVIALARLGKQIERRHGCPQDVEFAVESDRPSEGDPVLLQCRPETVWSARPHPPKFDVGHGVTRWISDAVTRGGGVVRPGGRSPDE